MEDGSAFMVIRIRFGRGPVVTRRKGKNSRIATLGASMLTLVSISCASLGMWRVANDLEWAGDFVFHDGFLSHWQVWIGAAASVQYAAWRLTRYARTRQAEPLPVAPRAQEATPASRAVANV